MNNERKLSELEQRVRKQRKRVQAHAVIDGDEQVTEQTACHFWRGSKAVNLTVGEFEKKYPDGELVILHIVYDKAGDE